MRIIITEEQFNNLIPPSVKRRMNPEDFVLIDNIIQTNKKYYLNFSFDIFFENLIRESLGEFIKEYKVEEINPNLDDDVWELEENLIYKIFWQLTPFLKKKYYDELYDHYMEYHRRRGNITESSDNKRNHLYRRIGEIEDVFKEYEDLFIRTAKGLDKDGFIHSIPLFIGDIIAGRLEEKGIDFDYVTFRNQIKVFVLSHFYQELNDFYSKHKKPLTESEHLKGLFSELPSYLKRRVTMEDLEWLDKSITGVIPGTPTRRDFDTFCYDVLGDLLHEFVVERKDDEIDTVEDPDYGLVYSEDGFNEVASIYWELMPFLKKRYEIKLRQAFERKRQQ